MDAMDFFRQLYSKPNSLAVTPSRVFVGIFLGFVRVSVGRFARMSARMFVGTFVLAFFAGVVGDACAAPLKSPAKTSTTTTAKITAESAAKAHAPRSDKTGKENPAAANEQMLTVWSEGEMLSKAEVTYSKLGFRIKSQIGSSFWTVKEPRVATLMNPENKVFLKMPVDAYIAELREDLRPMPVAKIQPGVDVSLPSDRKGKKFECLMEDKNAPGVLMKSGEFVCVDAKIPSEVHRMWCRFLTIPYDAKRGLPIGVSQIARRHMNRRAVAKPSPQRFKTIIAPRQIKERPLDISLFQIPKGYQQSKDRASLYFSVDGTIKENDIEDLFMQPLK